MPIDHSSGDRGNTPSPAGPSPEPTVIPTECGVVLIGHGETASALLAAARAIIPGAGLDDVLAIDAGAGRTPELRAAVCDAIELAEQGGGVLLLADLLGSSPCTCGMDESAGHGFAVVTGLNLAMLVKLATLDRTVSPRALADACADSANRSVCVKAEDEAEDDACAAAS